MLRIGSLALAGALAVQAAIAGDLASEAHRWWAHVAYLADDKLEGRNAGSPGHRKAAEYVAGEFQRLGLRPAGASGYLQPVRLESRRLIPEKSSLALVRNGASETLKLGGDAIIGTRIAASGKVAAPLVFVGYGLTVPENNHDDLKGLDLKGKVAVYLNGGPSSIPGALRAHYSSALERGKSLRAAGAVGAIAFSNPKHMDLPWERSALASVLPSMGLTDPALADPQGLKLSVSFNPSALDKLFAGSGHTAAEILALADADRPLPRFPLPASIRANVVVERLPVVSENVAGILEGSDAKLKGEYVVLSAHLDHLGVGRPIGGDSVYNGAMDNASGIATLLEIAEHIRAAGKAPKRSLLLVAVTAEEKGLLGSRYFAAHPGMDRKAMVANLNFDMFLPLFPLRTLTVFGLEESTLGDAVRLIAKAHEVAIQSDPEPERNRFIRSDQYSFIRSGVPALAFKVGYETGTAEEKIAKEWLSKRYHAPSDDLRQPVDLPAAAAFNRMMAAITAAVADGAERPSWKPESFFRRFSE
ncbi:MAG: M20/M25/M40 family metallo-hydrolase [Bryobacteraceae bacterium]